MLYLASDHAGFEEKEELKNYLKSRDIDFQDIGPDHFNENDDYPDFAYPAVARMNPNTDQAILLCGSGGGMTIIANKLKGIRATVAWNTDAAKFAKTDDNANVLSIPARLISKDDLKKIVDVWLSTPFSGAERHVRRLNKIKDLEDKLSPGSKEYRE